MGFWKAKAGRPSQQRAKWGLAERPLGVLLWENSSTQATQALVSWGSGWGGGKDRERGCQAGSGISLGPGSYWVPVLQGLVCYYISNTVLGNLESPKDIF